MIAFNCPSWGQSDSKNTATSRQVVSKSSQQAFPNGLAGGMSVCLSKSRFHSLWKPQASRSGLIWVFPHLPSAQMVALRLPIPKPYEPSSKGSRGTSVIFPDVKKDQRTVRKRERRLPASMLVLPIFVRMLSIRQPVRLFMPHSPRANASVSRPILPLFCPDRKPRPSRKRPRSRSRS